MQRDSNPRALSQPAAFEAAAFTNSAMHPLAERTGLEPAEPSGFYGLATRSVYRSGTSPWSREGDSNPRPLGYEPSEQPLLHPAVSGIPQGTAGEGRGERRSPRNAAAVYAQGERRWDTHEVGGMVPAAPCGIPDVDIATAAGRAALTPRRPGRTGRWFGRWLFRVRLPPFRTAPKRLPAL